MIVVITGPAIAALLVIGYLGVNSIVEWVRDQFKEKDDNKR